MAWFGQGKDTIEWEEFRDDVLFYKWKGKEIKKGSHLIIRAGQKAIFYANGVVEGVFEQEGNFDIATDITPFLSTLKGWFTLRGDTGMRAEVYFVNSKELLLPWGTRQRIMIPTPEIPSGVPVGCNGNLIIEFRDYLKFITKVAGVKETYSLDDISERIMGEMGAVVAESILEGENQIGLNALCSLQRNSRKLSKKITEELDKELSDFGMGVADVNIMSFNYPPEVQAMAEKVAAQSFVTNVGKYAAIGTVDSMSVPGAGGSVAAMGAQVAMGAQIAQQMTGNMSAPSVAPAAPSNSGNFVCSGCGKKHTSPTKFCNECGKSVTEASANAGERFCPKCRKMVSGRFCSECGSETV